MFSSLIALCPSKTENKSCFQNLFFKMEVIEKQAQTKVKYGDTVVDVQVSVSKIWSEQLSSDIGQASNYAPGGTGGDYKPYILVGAKSGYKLALGADLAITTTPEGMDDIKDQIRAQIEEFDDSGHVEYLGSPTFSKEDIEGVPRVHVTGLMDDFAFERNIDKKYRISPYWDKNENESFDEGERLETNTFWAKGIDISTYTNRRAGVRAGALTYSLISPVASRHLLAFSSDHSNFDGITSESSVNFVHNRATHNVGAAYQTDGTAVIPSFQCYKTTDTEDDVREAVEFQDALRALMREENVDDEIDAHLTPTHELHLPVQVGDEHTVTLNNKTMNLRFQGDSIDLHLGFGSVTAYVTSLSVTFRVKEVLESGYIVEVSDLDITGSLSDLYDWDFDATALGSDWLFERNKACAAIQAGYRTLNGSVLDTDGQIFYIGVDFSQDNYHQETGFSYEIPIVTE